MSALGLVILLYAVAALMLIAEIFLPSHGVLTVVGVGFLVAAIVKTFEFGTTAGAVSIVGSVILLPVFAVVAVKVWPHTWIGKMIAPPNPVYTRRDLGTDVGDLEKLVGRSGRSLSSLRPVGTCEFDGRRVVCVCESGLIDAGVEVRAVGLRGKHLEVACAGDEQSV